MSELETNYLIVGAGPAGASLACFLAQHGLKAVMISNAAGTADTPRAHLFNPFGVECLRDIGLEDDAKRMAVHGLGCDTMRWCESVLGAEYGRIRTWGSSPLKMRDMLESTPCKFMDLPQWYLEPILIRHASNNGIIYRFNTELVDFIRDENGIVSVVKDLNFGTTYKIRSEYLFGADGGRSFVARMSNFEFDVKPSIGVACNILFEANLEGRMEGREAQLNWVSKPDRKSRFGIGPAVRQIRPWHEWMLVVFTPGATDDPFQDLTPQSKELISYIRECLGDDTIEVTVKRIDPWTVRENVAHQFSQSGDIFLLGDAAHRHPPAFGLGGNTCIQDAYNLAWKIAYVSKGLAGPALLDTYHTERKPVGDQLVYEANREMENHARVWDALGLFSPTVEEGAKCYAELSASTEAGTERRAALHAALEGKRNEGESLGLNMNQWYTSSAVYLDDEGPRPKFEGNPIQDILISSYPGNRLPHAWLIKLGGTQEVAIGDLAGKGAFSLFTGHGGDAWREAAAAVTKSSRIPINVYGIGWALEYQDKYRDWTKRRDVAENGCVLVRPDRFVAWRSKEMIPDCSKKLAQVFDRILSRHTINGL